MKRSNMLGQPNLVYWKWTEAINSDIVADQCDIILCDG